MQLAFVENGTPISEFLQKLLNHTKDEFNFQQMNLQTWKQEEDVWGMIEESQKKIVLKLKYGGTNLDVFSSFLLQENQFFSQNDEILISCFF